MAAHLNIKFVFVSLSVYTLFFSCPAAVALSLVLSRNRFSFPVAASRSPRRFARGPGAIFDLLAFLALLITGLFMGFKAMNADPEVRKFYYINAYVCGVATFAYFAMLSGMGWETIMGCRQFFYVR